MKPVFNKKHNDLQNFPEGVVGLPPSKFPDERLFLYALIRAVQPRKVIEIGVSAGVGMVAGCRALKENGAGLWVGVDDWSAKHGGRARTPDVPRKNLKADGTPEKFFKFVSADSQEFLKKQKKNSADIVIVDGNHSYEYAYKDGKEAIRVSRYLVLIHDAYNLKPVHDACNALPIRGVFITSSRGYYMINVGGGK